MIFVDTWAWVAIADQTDQYHAIAMRQHHKFQKSRERYITTEFVLGEVIDYLYDVASPAQAQAIVRAMFARAESGAIRLIHVTSECFLRAWEMRQKYHDKPKISVVDFTSMAVMQDHGITDVFTGDRHFRQVNLGFRTYP